MPLQRRCQTPCYSPCHLLRALPPNIICDGRTVNITAHTEDMRQHFIPELNSVSTSIFVLSQILAQIIFSVLDAAKLITEMTGVTLTSGVTGVSRLWR